MQELRELLELGNHVDQKRTNEVMFELKKNH